MGITESCSQVQIQLCKPDGGKASLHSYARRSQSMPVKKLKIKHI